MQEISETSKTGVKKMHKAKYATESTQNEIFNSFHSLLYPWKY